MLFNPRCQECHLESWCYLFYHLASTQYRLLQVQYLQKLDFTVPDYDLVKNLAKKLNPLDQIVLYHDTHAHRGEGKTLSTIQDALIKHPNLLASRYISFKVPNTKSEIKGLSWRYLQIGTEVFWVEYTSTTDWRSNCGDGDINLFFRDKNDYDV